MSILLDYLDNENIDLREIEEIISKNPDSIYYGNNKWGLLPYWNAIEPYPDGMHKLCRMSNDPLPIIKKIINPKIASTPSSILEGRNLPLHFIAEKQAILHQGCNYCRQEQIYFPDNYYLPSIKYIFNMNPGAILKKNTMGETPLDIALERIRCIYYIKNGNNSMGEEWLDFLKQETDRALNNEARKIQRAWKECRDNPEYKMREKILVYNINS